MQNQLSSLTHATLINSSILRATGQSLVLLCAFYCTAATASPRSEAGVTILWQGQEPAPPRSLQPWSVTQIIPQALLNNALVGAVEHCHPTSVKSLLMLGANANTGFNARQDSAELSSPRREELDNTILLHFDTSDRNASEGLVQKAMHQSLLANMHARIDSRSPHALQLPDWITIIRHLLEHGADREQASQHLHTVAVVWPSDRTELRTLRGLLLQQGADPNRLHNDIPPLIRTCYADDSEGVMQLLAHGANLQFQDKRELTPLTAAALGGHTALVKLLFAQEAMPPTAEQRTLLEQAAQRNSQIAALNNLEGDGAVASGYGIQVLNELCSNGHQSAELRRALSLIAQCRQPRGTKRLHAPAAVATNTISRR